MLLQALLALFLLPARAATIDAAPVEAVGAFLRSPAPDWSSLEGVGRVVRGLDPADPAALQSAKPLVDLLQAEAADILASRPGPAATEAELRASADKLALLNDPAFRNLLAPEQQRRVAAAFWAYSSQLHADVRADVWTPSPLTLAEKIEGISRALDASRAVPAEESAPRLRQAEGVSVEAVAGDVARLPSDCLVSAVQLSGFCHGGINALIARQGREFARQVEAAKPLEDGRTLLAARAPGGKAAFKNVAFVADDMRLPLSEVVFRGLKAADDAGAKTVSLPALRTGWNFGFLEGTYERVVSETVLGLNRFLETARKSVERVSIVVRNNPRLLALFNDVKPADPEREALRKAALSGRGFELAPRPARVPARDLKSPIHRDMLAPWDLGRMLVARAPLRIGSIDDKKTFGGPVASVLNLPIKMPGSGFKIPAELEPMREFLQKIIDYEASVNPRMEEFYAYLTVDHGEVKKGDTHRRPGIHIDGVQGSRYPEKMPPEHTYSASDAVGTVFYAQPFDLRHVDPDRDYIHGELERQADESKAVKTADFGIYHWDSYSAHRADVAEKDTPRTFVRVEFSKKVYDSVGDSVNPLFNYAWPRVSRPIPYELNWHAQPLAKVVYEKGQRANAIGLELEGGVPAGEARRLRRLARARQASDVAPLARALSREPFVKAIRVSDKIPAIHDLVIDYPALDGRAAFPELGRPLDDKTVVEGSRKAGGHQADFLIDY